MMSIDIEELRKLAESMTGGAADILRQAANEIGLLRKHLIEAHATNADSERLDWLSEQAHEECSHPVCRTYFTLPRILTKKNGESATTLREAIDLVRKPRRDEAFIARDVHLTQASLPPNGDDACASAPSCERASDES